MATLSVIWTDYHNILSLWILLTRRIRCQRGELILLSSVGNNVYKTLRDVSYPDPPHGKTYKKLADLLKKHYRPQRSVVAERFRYRSCKQQPGQSISDYATNLKKLIASCEFQGDQLEQNLRDQFICGLRSKDTIEKLLGPQEKDYNFAQAVDMAIAEEEATKNVKDISGHLKSECGHATSGYHAKQNTVRYITEDEEQFEDFRDATFTITDDSDDRRDDTHDDDKQENAQDSVNYTSSKPVFLPVEIEGVNLQMELDTGAEPSMVNIKDYLKHFRNFPLKPVSRPLHAYAGTPLNLAGEINVDVKYQDQHAGLLRLVVVDADSYAPPLFGRD
ncbi:uncharacterized protein [Amphiura filiformis]|uniref:uncharacterized protein n=1 Tax=Amphiura filiformis TaxID=82378 RepID=UPI003B20D508